MAWASEIMAQNVKTRAVAIAAMNTSSSLMYTWAPLVLWPVTDAPRYRTGFLASVVFICVYAISIGLIGFFHFQHQKPSSADEIALLEEEMPVDGIPTSDMSIDDESKSDISSLYKHEDLQ
ncbi:hypothetical protein EC973_001903 [Apophysomyces ossiformis]|uniref:Major facilitator superfamily (MFS) profile domain-containing protein n=1 Tax=Apophysomyces ossiformis TaxID=679940 RepID=A0A8H7BRC9_9FUNG|nr:hypothetical protein EC973_001903 [Apophysomyces ossiformis]